MRRDADSEQCKPQHDFLFAFDSKGRLINLIQEGRKTRAILKGKAAETVSPLSKDTVRAGTHHSKGHELANLSSKWRVFRLDFDDEDATTASRLLDAIKPPQTPA